MKKVTLLTMVFAVVFSLSSQAQFGIQNSIRNKFEREAKAKAKKEAEKKTEEEVEKAEDKGMEAADQGLDKAREASDPGLEKAAEGEQQAEDAALYGIGAYNSWAAGYENDVASKDPAEYKKYPFESAVVEYEVEGSQAGTKTIYIDMGGYKVAEYRTIKKKKKEENTGVILIGPDMISIDYENKEVTKIHNPAAFYLANPDRDWVKTSENILTHMGFRKTGQETLLGKDCDVWKNGRIRLWVWNGLTIKSEDGKNVETATRIEIDGKVPGEKFGYPEDFEFMEVKPGDIFQQIDEDEVKAAFEEDEIDDELLDQVENMTYSEFKHMVREEDPSMTDEEIKQSYLYLRQLAKARHD